MVKTIRANMNVIESMVYFWEATKDREKVGEKYLVTLTEYDEMKLLFDGEFSAESMRKVLSAISNREMLNNSTQKERQFWNNNMWMLEDMDIMKMMVSPLKSLNLDDIVEKVNSKVELPYEDIEVVFVPANKEEYIMKGNKLIINFFRVQSDMFDEKKVSIGGVDLKEYIQDKICEMKG
ncbi:MAG: hypothetical protein ACRDA4_01460 [Filifactoraceae bacterium]